MHHTASLPTMKEASLNGNENRDVSYLVLTFSLQIGFAS